MTNQDILQGAKKVLNANFDDEKGFTIPCEGLYPFQWFWDSGFIAIGFAHYDPSKAKREIQALLSGQWSNGFIPHIVFHNETDTYFPGPDYHRTDLNPASPKNIKTTGITQPPVLGFVLEEIYNIVEDKTDIMPFIVEQIYKVYENHKYFYRFRDPKNEGLVYIYHNWESGTDNSPVWDDIWENIDPPKYKYKRKDTTHVDASQRPSNKEYDQYIHLIELAKSHRYVDSKIAETSPFLVQDPLFNAMLIKSNASLINLFKEIGNSEIQIEQLEKWQLKAKASFNDKLFNKNLNAYVHYDLRNERQLPYITSSSFTPLFAGIPDKKRAQKLVNTLQNKFGNKDQILCASFDPQHNKFNPIKYWRGPIWINLNWLLFKGLSTYKYDALADRLKKDTISLIRKHGFYEYFDCRISEQNNGAYGGKNFSWSAALTLDLINNKT